ncbi:MAG: hypothetical protein EAZ42_00385 [Verrucomicrobia bacterium]|nr:MAG: hypothetical protein EAZ42_00385 [Verrucomicrobiota bacterium]
MLSTINTHFTSLDWAVVIGYMILTTWIGHALSGKNATIKDFFLGGKSLPWWAVSGSMIATEISALTFIGVPGGVYAAQGDWTYLQWGIGSIIARLAVGYWLVPLYFKEEIYSPYDFMGARLGNPVRRLVTVLFSLGAVLGQSVRVLVTAIILNTVTGLSMEICIIIIGAFAVLWTLMGGMRTVIWTDVIQFVIFMFGGLLAFGWLVHAIGWESISQINQNAGVDGSVDKMRIWNFTPPWENPMLGFTFWVAIIAMPFQNLAAFGTDQLNAQRIFCCGSAKDARKAMVWSSVSLITTLLMLAVGSGLFAWYYLNPPNAEIAAKFAENTNFVFPIWITTVLPPGVTGLILAGAFAAAISSLDSVLAALSQTSLSAWYGREKVEHASSSKEMIFRSRVMVCVWAIVLSASAILLNQGYASQDNKNLISLAFGMVAYTYGPLLGILLIAILPGRRSLNGLVLGVVLSILAVAWIRPELSQLAHFFGGSSLSEWMQNSKPKIAAEWFYPINTIITVVAAYLPLGRYVKLPK